ncbi:MAG: tRNA-intron lyase [Candidatus Aenigmarchaeota archaeon]|nr:tRNA-intron lyase [Candidatus Aenigmarchaeota archaeon]
MLAINFESGKGIWAEGEDADKLDKNHFGKLSNGKLWLEIEEALFLMGFQNAVCRSEGSELSFNGLAAHFAKQEKNLFVRFNAYRDWRDRGLVIKRLEAFSGSKEAHGAKKYPTAPLRQPSKVSRLFWYSDSMFAVEEDEEVGRELFENYWLGQYGIYKQARGDLLKLSSLETIFLAKHFGFKVTDVASGRELGHAAILEQLAAKREYIGHLYGVYEGWRLAGYVVKTGFKFGSHFRIYFPGAGPSKGGKWVHSKHVLHVFPKEQKLLISEWARVVRVAHSVKKTFILAIPKLAEKDYLEYGSHFLAFRRKREKGNLVRETPSDGPRYLMLAVSEDEHLGGLELASLLKKAHDLGLELLLSITDRETSVTYYVLKEISLDPDSSYSYYEIEWMKP